MPNDAELTETESDVTMAGCREMLGDDAQVEPEPSSDGEYGSEVASGSGSSSGSGNTVGTGSGSSDVGGSEAGSGTGSASGSGSTIGDGSASDSGDGSGSGSSDGSASVPAPDDAKLEVEILKALGGPSARTNYSIATYSMKILIWGGWQEALDDDLNDGMIFDTSTKTWTKMSVTGAPSRRQGHSAVVIGSKMYVYVGEHLTPLSDSPQHGHYAHELGDGGVYDIVNDKWEPLVFSYHERSRPKAVAVGTTMIVWGGGDFVDYPANGYAFSYETTSKTTSTLSLDHDLYCGTYQCYPFGIGGSLYVWADTDASNPAQLGIYDPLTRTWTRSFVPVPVYVYNWWNGNAVIGNKVLVSSGFNASSVQVYDAATKTWRERQINLPAGAALNASSLLKESAVAGNAVVTWDQAAGGTIRMLKVP